MIHLPSPQQLRYLLALAETSHFGRAAFACSVTQSTLSAGIQALKRQLDARILDRDTGRRVAFTPLGRELLDHARDAVLALEAVTEAAYAAREPMTGPMRLGIIPTVGPFLLPTLMPLLRDEFPKLRLYLREDNTAQLVDRLEANRLDVILVALPCACGGAPVARDEFLVALSSCAHSTAPAPGGRSDFPGAATRPRASIPPPWRGCSRRPARRPSPSPVPDAQPEPARTGSPSA